MTNLCAICGKKPATTKDHIPPKGIYPTPRDNDINFNTVPSCSDCNTGASVNDEEFKVFIGLSTGAFNEKLDVIIDWIAGTVRKNQKIANQIFNTRRNVYTNLRSPIIEPAIAVTFDKEKYIKVITRIIRGLYWMQKGRALGYRVKISVFSPQRMEADFLAAIQELMSCLPPYFLNKDTFVYKVYFYEDGSSLWGMQFFKKHTVFGYASVPGI